MTKHTLGPWSYDGHGINSRSEAHKGERIFKTCLDYSHGSADRERAIADSNLVAAAPELLEACKVLIVRLDQYALNTKQAKFDWIAIEQAASAIAKAERGVR